MKLDINLLKHKDLIQQKNVEGKQWLYDIIRKKYIVATPEEWVRQLLIHFLLSEKKMNKNKIAVEKQLIINGMQKRFDLLVYNDLIQPHILIECKAPSISLNDDVFRQAANYNFALRAPFLIITNGIETYHCAIDFDAERYIFLDRS